MAERDQAVKRFVAEHFKAEKGLRMVVLYSRPDDDVQRLIEVNDATIPTGAVMPFLFEPSAGVPWRTLIADVTPDEWEAIQARKIPLPNGWPETPFATYDKQKASR